MVELSIQTADGLFSVRYSSAGLCSLSFPRPTRSAEIPPATGQATPLIKEWHWLTTAALESVLTGRPCRELPPFDLSEGTDFQQSVWRALASIQCGQTLSYGEVAEVIGRPKALRAVGQACGANPIPVLIPCHRVLAARGKIGGFSSDPKWKRLLLEREGVWDGRTQGLIPLAG